MSRLEILALLERLEYPPSTVQPTTHSNTPLSIANTQYPPFLYQIPTSQPYISIDNDTNNNNNNNNDQEHLLQRIQSIKDSNHRLTSYIRQIIIDYIFELELKPILPKSNLSDKRNSFLKLIQLLLNNNLLNPNSIDPTYIKVSTLDDPLIRFLLTNKLIQVHPNDQNKIKLYDLSINL
mgnify:CR=1 FL=1